jgi:hypothetical protein
MMRSRRHCILPPTQDDTALPPFLQTFESAHRLLCYLGEYDLVVDLSTVTFSRPSSLRAYVRVSLKLSPSGSPSQIAVDQAIILQSLSIKYSVAFAYCLPFPVDVGDPQDPRQAA